MRIATQLFKHTLGKLTACQPVLCNGFGNKRGATSSKWQSTCRPMHHNALKTEGKAWRARARDVFSRQKLLLSRCIAIKVPRIREVCQCRVTGSGRQTAQNTLKKDEQLTRNVRFVCCENTHKSTNMFLVSRLNLPLHMHTFTQCMQTTQSMKKSALFGVSLVSFFRCVPSDLQRHGSLTPTKLPPLTHDTFFLGFPIDVHQLISNL